MKPQSPIHRLLFGTAKKAHVGVEAWFAESKLGVTPLQFGVLRSIAEDGSTLNDLARRMALKPPSILPAVDLLERRGYLARRKKDKEDRRKVALAVTAKGKKIIERAFGSRVPDPLSVAFRKLSGSKKKQLISLLEELNGRMENK